MSWNCAIPFSPQSSNTDHVCPLFSQLQEEHKTTERKAQVLERSAVKTPMHKDMYSASQQVHVSVISVAFNRIC